MQVSIAQEQAKLQQQLQQAESSFQETAQITDQKLQDIENQKRRATADLERRQNVADTTARTTKAATLTVSIAYRVMLHDLPG